MEEERAKSQIEVEVKLKIEDYIRFNYFLNKKFLKWATALTISFIFVFTYLYYSKYGTLYQIPDQPIFVALFTVIMLYLSVYWRAKKVWNTNKFLEHPQHFIFTEQEIFVQSQISSSKLEWSKIYKIKETKRLLLIFVSNIQAFIIPKDYFKGDEYFNLKSLLGNKDLL